MTKKRKADGPGLHTTAELAQAAGLTGPGLKLWANRLGIVTRQRNGCRVYTDAEAADILAAIAESRRRRFGELVPFVPRGEAHADAA